MGSCTDGLDVKVFFLVASQEDGMAGFPKRKGISSG
jgi:hypothetical protein